MTTTEYLSGLAQGKIGVTWDGQRLVLESRVKESGVYAHLDRLSAKLARRGFRIERTGRGYLRYAYPVTPKYAHPGDKLVIGEPFLMSA